MVLSDFHYDLPEELIAQDPLEKRSDSRLMVVNRETGEVCHKTFTDILSYLSPGDCLVLNDTRVIPARLLGVKPDTGAAVEVLLLKRIDDKRWETIVRPGKKLRPGAEVSFGDGKLTGRIEEVLPEGNRVVSFDYEGIFEEVLDELGQMPLPPYITHKLQDRNRYQTVYAKHDGSAAAPTAGLHFTKELLAEVEKKGVKIAYVTLHVGLGTFRPVKTENILEHHMHTEYCEVSADQAKIVNDAKAAGGKIVCVGTTSVRTVESMTDDEGVLQAGSRDTDIFIYPGYRFRMVDRLITNFHLPESTLLMLVSAFYDREKVLDVYRQAVEERYRFFSFGDAMLLL